MQIQLLKTMLINTTTFEEGAILDLEVGGDRKNKMVAEGAARWYEEGKTSKKIDKPEGPKFPQPICDPKPEPEPIPQPPFDEYGIVIGPEVHNIEQKEEGSNIAVDGTNNLDANTDINHEASKAVSIGKKGK